VANLPQTASDLFDTLLPLGLAAYPEKAKEIGGVILFKITGERGGEWQLDFSNAPPKVFKGEAIQGASLTIELDHEDFKRLMVDYNAGLDLYFKNKLRISGDLNLALKLALFFDITRANPG